MSFYSHRKAILPLILLLLAALACTFTGAQPAASLPGAPVTYAAETWSAMQTSAYLSATPTYTPLPPTLTPTPTDTPRPTSSPTLTPSSMPTITPLPSKTPIPTNTPVTPTALPTATRYVIGGWSSGGGGGGGGGGGSGGGGGGGGSSSQCYAAELVRDVTIPNGQILRPGTTFTKIWRVKNAGTCTWWASTYMTPLASSDWQVSSSVSGKKIFPGDTFDFAVTLTLPNANGEYIGAFGLQVDSKTTLGEGKSGGFKVRVIASNADGVLWDFTNPKTVCEAAWRTTTKKTNNLGCPGKITSDTGFVVVLPRNVGGTLYPAKMEDGSVFSHVLWTNPPEDAGNDIYATYPGMLIQPGDRLRATVGCITDHPKCDVAFELYYQFIGGNKVPMVSVAHKEVYDGVIHTLFDDSISSGGFNFAGQYVAFTIRVTALNNSSANAAGWVNFELYR